MNTTSEIIQEIIWSQPLRIWLIDGQKPEARSEMPPQPGETPLHCWTLRCESILGVYADSKRPLLMGKRAYLMTTEGLTFLGGGDQPWDGDFHEAFTRTLNGSGEGYLWGQVIGLPNLETFYFVQQGFGQWEAATEEEYEALCVESIDEISDESDESFELVL